MLRRLSFAVLVTSITTIAACGGGGEQNQAGPGGPAGGAFPPMEVKKMLQARMAGSSEKPANGQTISPEVPVGTNPRGRGDMGGADSGSGGTKL